MDFDLPTTQEKCKTSFCGSGISRGQDLHAEVQIEYEHFKTFCLQKSYMDFEKDKGSDSAPVKMGWFAVVSPDPAFADSYLDEDGELTYKPKHQKLKSTRCRTLQRTETCQKMASIGSTACATQRSLLRSKRRSSRFTRCARGWESQSPKTAT